MARLLIRAADLGACALAVAIVGGVSGIGWAEEPQMEQLSQEQIAPEVSRDEWRGRVEEARRRAREAALDRRNHPERYLPAPPLDPGIEASQRVLNDDSLQRGDIVSTKRGLFVFRGLIDQRRGEDDFVLLPRH